MKTINLVLGFLFFSASFASAQQSSTIKMTAAEYQSLVETIIKAKRKKMAQRYYYTPLPRQQYPTTPTSVAPTTAAPAALAPITPTPSPVSEKKEELEKLYATIILQQKDDQSNAGELDAIKQKLMKEMEALDAQIKSQQEENERLTNKYYEKSAKEDSNLANRNIDLQFKLKSLENELAAQERETEYLQRAVERLKNKMEDLEKDQKNDLKSSEKEYANEVEKLEKQLKELEKQQIAFLQLAKNSSNDGNLTGLNTLSLFNQELSEIRVRVQSLETAKFVPNTNNNPPTFDNSAQVTLLENKVKELEAKINQIAKTESPTIIDSSAQLSLIQAQLLKMEKQLNSHAHTTSPKKVEEVKSVPEKTEAPKVTEALRTFVETRRQQNIYFQNGSAKMTPAEKSKIQNLANQLSIHQQVDITIKAFASNTGSFEVNQKLSQQRAENVRNTLINLGIRPNRLILEPLGIDTTSTDPANARRAEIHLFISEN
ncbi:MAG: OmpA family protein [Saprospiraceae bacterium]